MDSSVHVSLTPAKCRCWTLLAVARKAWRVARYYVDASYRQRLGWARDQAIGHLVYGHTGGMVIGGPFKGLKYVDAVKGSTLGPKLLGTYEKELNGIIERISARDYTLIVNIGAGEGYYAVGLAARKPNSRIICFEAFEENRKQLRRLAELNGVAERMDIRGFCTADSLNQAIDAAGDVVIICDVEGAEIDILEPTMVKALTSADLLVEMHDAIRSGISQEIERRFKGSHRIDCIHSQARTMKDWPVEIDLPTRQRLNALSESRGGPMTWLWMTKH